MLDSKALNVSASGAFYERASSRRHRLKRALSENSESQAEAIPLGLGGGAKTGTARKKHKTTRGIVLAPELPEAAAVEIIGPWGRGSEATERRRRPALERGAAPEEGSGGEGTAAAREAVEGLDRHSTDFRRIVRGDLDGKLCSKPEYLLRNHIHQPIKAPFDGENE